MLVFDRSEPPRTEVVKRSEFAKRRPALLALAIGVVGVTMAAAMPSAVAGEVRAKPPTAPHLAEMATAMHVTQSSGASDIGWVQGTPQAGVNAPPAPPAQRNLPGASICFSAYVQNIGWQSWACNGAVSGTVGQGLRIEELAIWTQGVGSLCANAHVQWIGWQGWRCGYDSQITNVGTIGQSLRMEALALQVSNGVVSANAHVQNFGWQGWLTGPAITVGTTGQSLRMEAIMATVSG